jgi:tetratricopeptide (TPR) repeat protein
VFWVLLLLPVLAGLNVGGNGSYAVGWLLINCWLFLLCRCIAVFPHEVGHAVAARLLGLRVPRVVIGTGAVKIDWPFLGGRLHICDAPLGGWTHVAFQRMHFRRDRCVVLVAGVLATLLVIAAILMAFDPSRVAGESLTRGTAPRQVLILVAFAEVAVNFWPRHIRTALGTQPNDGRQLVELARLTPARIDEVLRSSRMLEVMDDISRERFDQALARCNSVLAEDQNHLNALWSRSAVFLLLERAEEGKVELEALSARRDMPAEWRPVLANNLAWADVLLRPRDLSRADQLSSEALTALKDEPYAMGTRGSVLAEMGRAGEALPLLESALARVRRPQEKGDLSVHVAMALHGLGRVDEARRRFADAERWHPTSRLLDRVRRLFPTGV